jgi:tetratricopeptide (TPR) repeat protein
MLRMAASRGGQSFTTTLCICLLLGAAVLVVYAQVREFGFVNYDDPSYVYENEHVRSGVTWPGVRWALTSGMESNWLPLTRLSHMLDCHLFGLAPGAHHAVNVLLHLANSLLLFGVLRTMTGATWRSAWVAGVFAVHPVHAESVAWVSERKDVLSTLLGLLSLWGYVRYTRAPSRARYALSLLAFAGSLLAKQMLVTLPLLFLLLDLWPLGRLTPAGRPGASAPRSRRAALLTEKIPFILVAVAAGGAALAAQWAGGSVLSTAARPMTARLANAVMSYVRYVGHLLWPADLTFFYPYHPWPTWQATAAAALLLAITSAGLWLARRRPYVLVGWSWYLLTLLPVIGLVQVGDQALADRYTYFPSIGLCIVAAWGACDLLGQWRFARLALASAGALTVLVAAAAGARQTGTWRDSRTLLTRALAVTPDNHIAHNNLGFELEKEGRLDEAMAHYAVALRLAPDDPKPRNNLGRALATRGDLAGAIEQYTIAVQLRPRFADAQQSLADALAQSGQMAAAVAHYRAAADLGRRTPSTLNNLGVALSSTGDIEGGLQQYLAALALDPNHADARANAARALIDLDRPGEAVVHLEAIVRRDPDNAAARLQLAELLARENR